jgi:hypothetical protein
MQPWLFQALAHHERMVKSEAGLQRSKLGNTHDVDVIDFKKNALRCLVAITQYKRTLFDIAGVLLACRA